MSGGVREVCGTVREVCGTVRAVLGHAPAALGHAPAVLGHVRAAFGHARARPYNPAVASYALIHGSGQGPAGGRLVVEELAHAFEARV